MVRWLRLCTSNAAATGSSPSQETKILYAIWRSQKIKIEKKKFFKIKAVTWGGEEFIEVKQPQRTGNLKIFQMANCSI